MKVLVSQTAVLGQKNIKKFYRMGATSYKLYPSLNNS